MLFQLQAITKVSLNIISTNKPTLKKFFFPNQKKMYVREKVSSQCFLHRPYCWCIVAQFYILRAILIDGENFRME